MPDGTEFTHQLPIQHTNVFKLHGEKSNKKKALVQKPHHDWSLVINLDHWGQIQI